MYLPAPQDGDSGCSWVINSGLLGERGGNRVRCSTLPESVELLRLSMASSDRGALQIGPARRISAVRTDLVQHCTSESLPRAKANQNYRLRILKHEE